MSFKIPLAIQTGSYILFIKHSALVSWISVEMDFFLDVDIMHLRKLLEILCFTEKPSNQ